MNDEQRQWWTQVVSDHATWELLRRSGAAPCHQLHYLQMITEKLTKAFLWRARRPPPRSHVGLGQFLRLLLQVPRARQPAIAMMFGFRRFADMQRATRAILGLAYRIERLAPALAQDGPNAEYPWPHDAPREAPAEFAFPEWTKLTSTVPGRRLMQFITVAVAAFPRYSQA